MTVPGVAYVMGILGFMQIDVTRAKLDELLAMGTEHTQLDYKQTVDFKAPHDVIEITKHIGAFMDHGGYIVIGADNHGVPTGGVVPGQEGLLDEARLRPMLQRYIPKGFEIHTRIHEVSGVPIGLIQVQPHPAGACIFQKQGEYQDPTTGKQVVVFREGDIFTRHGTSSERADVADLQRIMGKAAKATERPRAEMDDAALRRAVADSFGEKVAMVDVLEELRVCAEDALAQGDRDALLSTLDKLATVAEAAITYGEGQWLPQVMDRLQAIYELGFEGPVRIPGDRPRLWFDVVGRVMATGAIAVSEGRDDLVPAIVLRAPAGMDRRSFTNWIYHAAVHVERARFLRAGDAEISFLGGVETEIGSVAAISRKFRTLEERRNALAQFDALAAITVWGNARNANDDYPYWATFATYEQDRYEPAIVRVIENPALRESLFGGTEDELRQVLLTLEDQARKNLAGFGGGGGRYIAPEILRFLGR